MDLIKTFLKYYLQALIVFLFLLQPAYVHGFNYGTTAGTFTSESDSIAVEIEHLLKQDFKLWYPLVIDSDYGGYYSDINYKWELEGAQSKMVVTQARHIWSNAYAAMYYKEKEPYFSAAAHGVKFLKDVMWDKEYGGFYDLVSRRGEPIKEKGEIIKRAYGNVFAIYALAAYYKAFGVEAALELAKKGFNWLEEHSYDPLYGGYFQFMHRDGTPFKEDYGGTPPKDQNSSIHILECLTELYGAWPDKVLADRLTVLQHIIRDVITTEKGYMNLFFQRDWTPVSFRDSSDEVRKKNEDLDHVSFGHDIETAYLLLEASEALGIKNDTLTLRLAKNMVDHSIRNGWDKDFGGIYDRGYYFNGENKITIIKNTKEWWSEAEAMNSLLLMSEFFPEDKMNYFEKFSLQWEYIKKYLIDIEHGGWYWGGIDRDPSMKLFPKSTIWKADYHTARALINCLKRLTKKSL